MVRNTDLKGPTISPDDLSRHMYIVGASGCGKTTLIRQLAKHLEMANLDGASPNSFIYIDVKDEDSKLFLRQAAKGRNQDPLLPCWRRDIPGKYGPGPVQDTNDCMWPLRAQRKPEKFFEKQKK